MEEAHILERVTIFHQDNLIFFSFHLTFAYWWLVLLWFLLFLIKLIDGFFAHHVIHNITPPINRLIHPSLCYEVGLWSSRTVDPCHSFVLRGFALCLVPLACGHEATHSIRSIGTLLQKVV